MQESAVGLLRPAGSVRQRIPPGLRRTLGDVRWAGLLASRLPTARWRRTPDFVIIGAQKAGTTSLFQYLGHHPQVRPPIRKEIHYFDLNFHRGSLWYRAHFPLEKEMGSTLTGEASPYYLYHPQTPARMKELLPDVKLIVLLRNPVDRTYSAYQHERRLGRERLSFIDAINAEASRVEAEATLVSGENAHRTKAHTQFSYVRRSLYAEQLERWFQHFPREQFHIIRSEDLFDEPSMVLSEVREFLRLEPWAPPQYVIYKKGVYPDLDASLIAALAARFRPHNQRLYGLIGRDMGWERGLDSHSIGTSTR